MSRLDVFSTEHIGHLVTIEFELAWRGMKAYPNNPLYCGRLQRAEV